MGEGAEGAGPSEAVAHESSLDLLRASGFLHEVWAQSASSLVAAWLGRGACVSNYRPLNRTTSQLHPSKMPNCRLQI